MEREYWQIWIDTGGTFTDCFSIDPQGKSKTLKVLSNSSLRCRANKISDLRWKIQHDWPIQANILSGYKVKDLDTDEVNKIKCFDPELSVVEFSKPFERSGENINLVIESTEEVPILAARILTQTPLDQPLPILKMRLGSTRGTNALLERKGAKTAFLVTKGFRDLLTIGTQQRPNLFSLDIVKPLSYYDQVFELDERLDASGRVLRKLNNEEIKKVGKELVNKGFESVAIAFLHSYKNDEHELEAGAVLHEMGLEHISLSSDLFNAIKILPRAETSVANAFLSPVIKNYINNIEKSIFAKNPGDLKVMTSAGGLMASTSFKPKDSLLSGPAGGLVGAAVSAAKSGITKILTLDMGGTSTDVARYDEGFDYRYETKVGSAQILSPALSIETIAAGGGSICSFDGFRFTVGPESAGAHPGPACYGAGGPMTITDVNLLLGKIDANNFGIPVYMEKSKKALTKLQTALSTNLSRKYTQEEILQGFEQIANEKMAEAIKRISVSKGYDPQDYSLLAFGGAGGQHACQVAEILGMNKILIPKDAGLLSAYGIGQAYIERFAEKQVLKVIEKSNSSILQILSVLKEKVFENLKEEGFSESEIEIRETLFYLRFVGQENTLKVTDPTRLIEDFKIQYQKLYGHWIEGKKIELESIKVVGSNRKSSISQNKLSYDKHDSETSESTAAWVDNQWRNIPSYRRELLRSGAKIEGPAIIGSNTSTTFLPSNWTAEIDGSGNFLINRKEDQNIKDDEVEQPEEARLELFSNRFTAIAEEMGALLQRASFSVNIKERLDFSCALLDADGYLVVNAPHIPVHLGSLGICVRTLTDHIKMEEGDVVITNHPGFGGSHLPDITLVSPVFYNGTLAGFVANRGHHAEVGGIMPGSMPPQAKSLEEEGVVIEPTYLVKRGEARWDEVRKIFTNAAYPTRSIEENIADLNGALASVRLGVKQLTELIRKYDLATVKKYMAQIKLHAHAALNNALADYKDQNLEATEYLDNGAVLNVKIQILGSQVTIDFAGTSDELPNSFNATPAITTSAILYVLRLITGREIPLNEGLLNSVRIHLPKCMLNPDFQKPAGECPPVVGGNTETSQRLVDTLLKAFGLVGCSQGTMNNLLFGNDSFGYYETICGGTGAGQGFNGADAVHQHMTNTRITDPEIMELRYPVRVDHFKILKGSGGKGKWHGGNGISRKIIFTKPCELTILSQHRKEGPYGSNGGQRGKVGKQWVKTKKGNILELQGCDSYSMQIGDAVVINTPGGGGFGEIAI